jgi:hypothetical protein
MKHAYCNMWVAPRSTVTRRIAPLGKYLVLDPAQLACEPAAYIAQHGEPLGPARFMIGVTTALPAADCELCTDPALIIAILGRLAGRLYIPRRPLRVDGDGFKHKIAFLRSEVCP